MRVSIVIPPTGVLPYPPWLAPFIANAANENDIEFKFFDINKLDWMKLRIPWADIAADIIGVSLNFSLHHRRYVKFLKQLRVKFPQSLILVGGVHATAISSHLAHNEVVDCIAEGTGEDIINYIIERFSSKKRIPKIVNAKLLRVSVPNKNHKTKHVYKTSKYYDCMGKLNLDQYDNLHLKYPAILYKGLPSRHVFLQRRCPFKCKHCVETLTTRLSHYEPNVDDTITDIAFRNKKSHFFHAYFLDPTFNSDKRLVDLLCCAIQKKGLQLTWGCKARLELFSPTLIDTIAQAGCSFVEVGIEAIDNVNLAEIGKPILSNKILSNLDRLTKHDISIQCNFMLGLPHDDLILMEKRIEYAHKISTLYNILPCFWVYCPFPASALWEQLNLRYEKLDWEALSMTPVLKYKELRKKYVYLPIKVTGRQMTNMLNYAWNMPSNQVVRWFGNNKLLHAALQEKGNSFNTYIKKLFHKRIGDFINSDFFIV